MPFDRGEHRVDVLDEIERGAVEELVLLLDPEGVRVALPEPMVEDARCLSAPFAPLPVMSGGISWLPVSRTSALTR